MPDKVEIPANIIRTQPAKTRYQQSPRSTTDALTRKIPHEATFGTPTNYNFAEWRDVFKRGKWDSQNLTFTDEISSLTLESDLLQISKIIQELKFGLENGWHHIEEIKEKIKERRGPANVRWHLNLMVLAGTISRKTTDQGEIYRHNCSELVLPPVPDSLPKGLYMLGDANLKGYLRNSLGLNEADDQQIGLILNAAFVGEVSSKSQHKARVGRQWLDRFLTGNGPPWLIEVCREYVRDHLYWEDSLTWPECIRPSDIESTE